MSHFFIISFLIDGYVRCRYKTENTYTWEWEDEGYSGVLPYRPDRITTSYSSPIISYFKMNWGGGSEVNYQARFALSDSWTYYNQIDSVENYQYKRSMILVNRR